MTNFEDTLIMDEINVVSLDDYLQLLNASADVSPDDPADLLRDIFIEKVGDSAMGALIDSLMENGFIAPIELQIIDDGLGGMLFSQGNGHHRLVAAILLGMDRIAIYPRIATDAWDICFNRTESEDNKYFGNRYLTDEGFKSNAAWRPLLLDISNEFMDARDEELDW